MNDFRNYSETLKFDDETLIIYSKILMKKKEYYICEDSRVFETARNTFKEVENKNILKQLEDMIVFKEGNKYEKKWLWEIKLK